MEFENNTKTKDEIKINNRRITISPKDDLGEIYEKLGDTALATKFYLEKYHKGEIVPPKWWVYFRENGIRRQTPFKVLNTPVVKKAEDNKPQQAIILKVEGKVTKSDIEQTRFVYFVAGALAVIVLSISPILLGSLLQN